MDKYTSGAFENYAPEDVDGLLKDRGDEAIKHFKDIYEDLEELCEGVEAPREDLQYLHYFCGVSGMSEDMDEIYARLREKLYKLVSSLVRAYAEAKDHTVSGMLLYTKTDEEIYPNNVYQMSGNQIMVRALDLNLPFTEIAKQLNTIAKVHFNL